MDIFSLDHLIPSLIAGTIGWLLGWFMKPSRRREGDLTVEGEGALRAEADTLRARVQDLEGRVTARDQEVSDLKTQLASESAAPAANGTTKTTEADDTYALEWQNRYLAARVKYLDSRLAELSDGDDGKAAAAAAPAAAKKAPAKKAPAKKPTAKKAASKKPAAKKAATKTKAVAKPKKTAVARTAAAKTKATPATKKAPAKSKKSAAKSKDDAAMDRYYEKVQKFDPKASRKVVENIVDYCGISLKSRDSSLVACTDEAELRRVANGFVTKKLGLEKGQMELVQSVCEQMKGQRLKSRVTFYYLTAKKARKLGMFR